MSTRVKVGCRIGGTDVQIEAELEKFSQMTLMKLLSMVGELSVEKCGLCESTALRARVRQHKDFQFPELICLDCGGQLQFGQRKDGSGLFPKDWGKYEGNQRGGSDDASSGNEDLPW